MTTIATSAGRDPRLDFFRGAAMFIIFIAHCRGNFLWSYIPARFGMSDAADMFVFLSGMAASIAFGGAFVRHGALIGTARILYRCWQLMVAHLGMFFTGAFVAAAGTRWFGDTDYVEVLRLHHFFDDTPNALIQLFTLRYVPNYFDILPLYMIVLAMVPVAMLLARLHPMLVVAASLALYLAAAAFHLDFPANADGQPQWFFDPLAWQLIFFTGFALRRGWVRVPLYSPKLLIASVAILVVGLAISLPPVFEHSAAIDALRIWIGDHSNKTYLDPLQYFHFLASVYVVLALLAGREAILLSPMLRPFVKCGQQALAVFVSGMILSHVASMVFDHAGTGFVTQVAVNGACFALLFAVAYTVAWFKAQPWKRRPAVAPIAASVPDVEVPPAVVELRGVTKAAS
jgi:hypothetical protein